MKTTVTELLEYCKDDSKAMEELIDRFMPLIRSYSRKKGWQIETEDLQSILTIKLMELAMLMKISSNEAQNIKFIANSLRNHFLDVVRKINRIESIEFITLESIGETGQLDEDNMIFYDMIKNFDKRKQEIICLKFKDMCTDQEIAEKLGITRQAVNKQLRTIYKQLTNMPR